MMVQMAVMDPYAENPPIAYVLMDHLVMKTRHCNDDDICIRLDGSPGCEDPLIAIMQKK